MAAPSAWLAVRDMYAASSATDRLRADAGWAHNPVLSRVLRSYLGSAGSEPVCVAPGTHVHDS